MIFYNLIVAPIELIVDWVFTFFTIKFTSFGVIGAVCGVSLAINFLALPLYNIADSLQAKERRIAKEMEPRIQRIKRAFKGDERFMILQTYYRECNYNPLYTLRSSLSILIEIPFFIAAYHYLSHSAALKGIPFWIFKDLGAPDALFQIGNFSVNVLPVLMTAINLVSGAVYAKDTTARERIQIFVLAAVFLVLLYSSPSGLVIYWILNNLFSLAKNVVLKMKHPAGILRGIIGGMLLLFSVYFIYKKGITIKTAAFSAFSLFVVLFAFVKKAAATVCGKIQFCRPKAQEEKSAAAAESSKRQFLLFILSALGLAVLCGLYLPSSAVSTSPIEFSFLEEGADSPLPYIWSSLFTFLGFFVIWPLAVYLMFGGAVKKWESAVFFAAFLMALADVFVFKADYGTLDVLFQVDRSVLSANTVQKIVPAALSVLVLVLFFVLSRLQKLHIASAFILAVCVAETVIGFANVSSINKTYAAYAQNRAKNEIEGSSLSDEITPVYHLTKTGKNVVVLFLDRAIGSFLPYALLDVPDLKEQLRGFVYYPNTLSFGQNTDIAAPAMMAGYEYTPENLNARNGELLRAKHNEASLVLPTLFADAGYECTITDPPCPNYTWKGDLSAFEGKQNIRASEILGTHSERFCRETKFYGKNTSLSESVKKEIKNFSVLQVLLPVLRNTFNGDFIASYRSDHAYIDMISCLYYLPELTDCTAEKSQYVFIDNETTHQPIFLDDDFLLPAGSLYFHGAYETSDDNTATHYQAFVAAFKQVGKWLDFLRENDAYDNTRVIIVSDHGREITLNDFSHFADSRIPASYTPILLFKDFGSNRELSIDKTFMTNADTLFLAKQGLELNEENPFTHSTFSQEKQNGITVYPTKYLEWNAEKMADKFQFTLDKAKAFHVHTDIFDKKNWIPLLEWEKRNENQDQENSEQPFFE